MKRTPEEFRKLMRKRIAERDYECLFSGGACYFFALVLHEELSLPLFYASPQEVDEYCHVFVRQGAEGIDFSGRHKVTEIAKLYVGWSDVPPRSTTAGQIREKIKGKMFGDELEAELFQIARDQFKIRRDLYE